MGFTIIQMLEDIPLSDGVYEVEVRPSDLFWQDCYNRKKWTLSITDTDDLIAQDTLPVIQNLRKKINSSSFKPTLKWSIAGDEFPVGMHFGVWFSDTTPVDINVSPTAVIPFFSGQHNAQNNYTQTATQYIAIAAIDDASTGQIAICRGRLKYRTPPNQIAEIIPYGR